MSRKKILLPLIKPHTHRQALALTLGYARVSTNEADTAAQVSALKSAGCEKIFREKASGGRWDRLELQRLYRIFRFIRHCCSPIPLMSLLEELSAILRLPMLRQPITQL